MARRRSFYYYSITPAALVSKNESIFFLTKFLPFGAMLDRDADGTRACLRPTIGRLLPIAPPGVLVSNVEAYFWCKL